MREEKSANILASRKYGNYYRAILLIANILKYQDDIYLKFVRPWRHLKVQIAIRPKQIERAGWFSTDKQTKQVVRLSARSCVRANTNLKRWWMVSVEVYHVANSFSASTAVIGVTFHLYAAHSKFPSFLYQSVQSVPTFLSWSLAGDDKLSLVFACTSARL